MPKKVVIDGVLYVPVSEVSIDRTKLLKALASEFWSEDSMKENTLDYLTRDLFICVTDANEWGSEALTVINFVDDFINKLAPETKEQSPVKI